MSKVYLTEPMFDKKSAMAIVGGLSEPSKMPCFGFSIPASKCNVGSKLRNVPGSICSKCYACKGRYVFGVVKNALQRRYEAFLNHRDFVPAMVYLINNVEKSGFFRFFDSGDIPNAEAFEKIIQICRACPSVKFWLPTKEYEIVSDWVSQNGKLPENLTIRLSAYMVDGAAPTALAKRLGANTSTVAKKGKVTCPAPEQGGKCDMCRMCWDKSVKNVAYHAH